MVVQESLKLRQSESTDVKERRGNASILLLALQDAQRLFTGPRDPVCSEIIGIVHLCERIKESGKIAAEDT